MHGSAAAAAAAAVDQKTQFCFANQ